MDSEQTSVIVSVMVRWNERTVVYERPVVVTDTNVHPAKL
jgi:hypothetical protein